MLLPSIQITTEKLVMVFSIKTKTKHIIMAFHRHKFHKFVSHYTLATDFELAGMQERERDHCGRRNDVAIFICELDVVSNGAAGPIAIALLPLRIKHYLVVQFHLLLDAAYCFGVVTMCKL
jgi:hypothetical protein